MPTWSEKLPTPKPASWGRGTAAPQAPGGAAVQLSGSPELTQALQIGDKQYFIFHSDVDYEPGKSKLKR